MPGMKKSYGKPIPAGGGKGGNKKTATKKPPTPVKPLPVKGSKRGR